MAHRSTQTGRNRGGARVRLTILAGVLLAVGVLTSACSSASSNSPQTSAPAQSQTAAPSTAATPPAAAGTTEPAPTTLQIKDTVVGKGAAAKAGDSVTVDYTGWLLDGTEFDSSVGKQPFTFTIGAGRVIPGWDQGVAGMEVGGTRVLVIPPDLAYGAQGAGGVIPPNAPLKFEVKLLAINPAAQ